MERISAPVVLRLTANAFMRLSVSESQAIATWSGWKPRLNFKKNLRKLIMCNRHSFILTKAGKIHHGYGLTDSHTSIRELAGLHANDDTVNAYEWQPPEGWPNADWEDGLTKDTEVFLPKSSHLDAIGRHIKSTYPTQESWDKGDACSLPPEIHTICDLDLRGYTHPLPDSITSTGDLDLIDYAHPLPDSIKNQK